MPLKLSSCLSRVTTVTVVIVKMNFNLRFERKGVFNYYNFKKSG